jgi:hypothetical protein
VTGSPAGVGPHGGGLLGDRLTRKSLQGLAYFLWGGEAEVADLVQGLDLGVPGRAFGHHQSPDGLHVAVLGLGRPQLTLALGRPGRFDGIDGVGLAFAPALLAVGAVHLDHLCSLSAQVPGEAGPVRAGAFHPDPGHRAEPGHPFPQLLVASYGRGERLDAQQATDVVQHGGHVDVQVGVDATGNRARSTYDCHGHPFLFKFGSGWHRRYRAAGGSSCYSRAIRRTPTTAPPPRTWPTNCSPQTG